MIYTSNYDTVKGLDANLVSISGNKGIDANFEGKYAASFAPKYLFWRVWHDNKGAVDDKINMDYYINQYYYQVLKRMNLEYELNKLGENPILLCYESSNEFCHRFLLASYIELKTKQTVPEIIGVNNKEFITTDYKPCYVKDKMARVLQIHRDL